MRKENVTHKVSSSYCLESIDHAENRKCSVFDMVQSMMIRASDHLGYTVRAEMKNTARHLHNRLSFKSTSTPETCFNHSRDAKTIIAHFRLFDNAISVRE